MQLPKIVITIDQEEFEFGYMPPRGYRRVFWTGYHDRFFRQRYVLVPLNLIYDGVVGAWVDIKIAYYRWRVKRERNGRPPCSS